MCTHEEKAPQHPGTASGSTRLSPRGPQGSQRTRRHSRSPNGVIPSFLFLCVIYGQVPDESSGSRFSLTDLRKASEFLGPRRRLAGHSRKAPHGSGPRTGVPELPRAQAGVHSASDTEHVVTSYSTGNGEELSKPNSDYSRASSLPKSTAK